MVRVAALRMTTLALIAGCGRIEFDAQTRGDADVADVATDTTTEDGLAGDPALALYIPFEGSFADASSHAAAVQCAFCPTYAPGRVGLGAVYSGTTCLQLAGGAPRFQAPQFTIAAWIRADVANGQTVLSKTYDSMSSVLNSWEIWMDSAPTLVVTTTDGAGNLDLAGGTLTVGTWEHVAATYDGTSKRMYRNGTEVAAEVIAPTVYDGSLLMFGCDRDAGVNVSHFVGMLDELRVYERALSAVELAALAQ